MALPPVRLERNLKLIGHNGLGAGPNAGEGLAMKITPEGRWLFYVAHENPPMAMSILDVTDPTKPELVYQSEVPHNDVRGNSLAIRGDTLLLASQCFALWCGVAVDWSVGPQARAVATISATKTHRTAALVNCRR